jgi:hypothetical protein
MAENKKSFIAYTDWKETFDSLPDEKAGQLIKHLFAYVNDENPCSTDILIIAVFANIKQQLKRDLKKWEGTSKIRSDIGKKGGVKSGESRRSKQTKQMLKKRSKTKQNEHDTVNVNDNVNDIEEIGVNKAWIRWKKFKEAEFNFKYKSDISEEAAKTELINLSENNEEIAIKIIEQSIAKGWKGFFKLKINGNERTNSKGGATPEQLRELIARTESVDK